MNGEPTNRTEDTKLDPAFKARWLEALRSGRYQQGKCYLRQENDSFCCMGVALDLIDPTKWGRPYDHFDGRARDWGRQNSSSADDSLAATLGLPKETVAFLARMNDSRATESFSPIADWIEENL